MLWKSEPEVTAGKAERWMFYLQSSSFTLSSMILIIKLLGSIILNLLKWFPDQSISLRDLLDGTSARRNGRGWRTAAYQTFRITPTAVCRKLAASHTKKKCKNVFLLWNLTSELLLVLCFVNCPVVYVLLLHVVSCHKSLSSSPHFSRKEINF